MRRVIIATRDPNPQVTGGGAEFLAARGVDVDVGLLAAEARRLNEAWFHYVNTGRPWVMAKAACSLDGKIATAGGESQWLTGEAARALGHRLRHRVDAIVVGIGTVLADNPQLTTRLRRGRGRDPIRIVLDSRLRLPLTSRLLHLDSEAPTWVASPARPRRMLSALWRTPGPRSWCCRPTPAGWLSRPCWTAWGPARCKASWWKGGPRPWEHSLTRNWYTNSIFFMRPKSWGAEKPREWLEVRG